MKKECFIEGMKEGKKQLARVVNLRRILGEEKNEVSDKIRSAV